MVDQLHADARPSAGHSCALFYENEIDSGRRPALQTLDLCWSRRKDRSEGVAWGRRPHRVEGGAVLVLWQKDDVLMQGAEASPYLGQFLLQPIWGPCSWLDPFHLLLPMTQQQFTPKKIQGKERAFGFVSMVFGEIKC